MLIEAMHWRWRFEEGLTGGFEGSRVRGCRRIRAPRERLDFANKDADEEDRRGWCIYQKKTKSVDRRDNRVVAREPKRLYLAQQNRGRGVMEVSKSRHAIVVRWMKVESFRRRAERCPRTPVFKASRARAAALSHLTNSALCNRAVSDDSSQGWEAWAMWDVSSH